MILWFHDSTTLWFYDPMTLWLYGYMTLWSYAFMIPWFYDLMILWSYDSMTFWSYDSMLLWRYEFLASGEVVAHHHSHRRVFLTVGVGGTLLLEDFNSRYFSPELLKVQQSFRGALSLWNQVSMALGVDTAANCPACLRINATFIISHPENDCQFIWNPLEAAGCCSALAMGHLMATSLSAAPALPLLTNNWH